MKRGLWRSRVNFGEIDLALLEDWIASRVGIVPRCFVRDHDAGTAAGVQARVCTGASSEASTVGRRTWIR